MPDFVRVGHMWKNISFRLGKLLQTAEVVARVPHL
jgi:hypothetical protein